MIGNVSPLCVYTKESPFNSGKRPQEKIDRITPHCTAGITTIEALGEWFTRDSVQASANYGIGEDGKIGMFVDESKTAWTSSNQDNDKRAITIECSSSNIHPYTMSSAVYGSLYNLCVDICRRYGKTRLLWISSKDKALAYNPGPNEMILTVHRWFALKACPGDWLYTRLGALADSVTCALQEHNKTIYRVQIGAFYDKSNAQTMLDKLRAAGFDGFITSAKEG